MSQLHPVIDLHLIPEDAAFDFILNAGSEVHFIRFDDGMVSGGTAIGIAIAVDTSELLEALKGDSNHPIAHVLAQTSLSAMRSTMAALEAAEERDAAGPPPPPPPNPIEAAEEANHGRPLQH